MSVAALLIQIYLKMLLNGFALCFLHFAYQRPVRPCSLQQCHGAFHGTLSSWGCM